jgi:hypothetical protein
LSAAGLELIQNVLAVWPPDDLKMAAGLEICEIDPQCRGSGVQPFRALEPWLALWSWATA